MRKLSIVVLAAAAFACAWTSLGASQAAPLRIFLRGGPKTHGPAINGQHDGPTWVKEWQPLLASRGAMVEGALRFPTGEELDRTDVLVMFAADAGRILGDDRAHLETFLRRGGGIIALHDAVVTPQEPHWFKTIVGGAWENRVAKYFEGENTYYYVNTEHPIVKGAANFTIDDEVYWDLHMMPNAQILAASMQPIRPAARGVAPPAEPAIRSLIPQIWVYENQLSGGQPYRAFVSLLGHHFASFSSPHVRGVLLRAIAWVGKRDVDSLATADEIAALK
jgi:type 1 glutamine amidotransferase